MQRAGTILGLTVAVILVAVISAPAQQLRTVENPLQEEFAYTTGTELKPQVTVAGVNWLAFSLQPKEGKELVEGEEIPVVMSFELENTSTDPVDALVIVLLEDERGSQLARLEAGTLRLKEERRTEEKKKLKVDGGALRSTTKIWAYVDISR